MTNEAQVFLEQFRLSICIWRKAIPKCEGGTTFSSLIRAMQ